MRIAVLGGGNGAYAAAADLAERGHEVRLWRRDGAALSALAAAGGRITLKDAQGARAVPLALASAELGVVLQGAALVIVAAPAFAQAEIAAAMAPHVTDGQVVLLPPGSFGSYAMAVQLRAAGSRARVSFAESGTLPYLARKHGPATVAIAARATRLPTGVFPFADAERVLAVIAAAYPSVEPCGDALSGALMNAGPIIHPPLILMNAGPLEHFPRWDIHNEGTQPSIRRVTTALDEERIALRKALGYGPPHFPLADHYRREPGGEAWMYGAVGHEQLVDSGDWREKIDLATHRYMREDVVYGLAFLVSVARWAGVAAPVAAGLLALASAVLGEALDVTSPRRLEALDLARLTPAELQSRLARGFA